MMDVTRMETMKFQFDGEVTTRKRKKRDMYTSRWFDDNHLT